LINQELIRRTIAPLPPALRDRIFLNLLGKIEEAKAVEKPEKEVEQEVVDTILRELFLNLIEPIEMVDQALGSNVLKETPSFKIEFSEMLFDRIFIDKTQGFRDEFWSLVKELGRLESVLPKGQPLNWKGAGEQ
jgi:hypothetical protein